MACIQLLTCRGICAPTEVLVLFTSSEDLLQLG